MNQAVATKPANAPLIDPLAGVSPDTLARAIKLIEEQQAAERAAAERRRLQAETGYPKVLYNPIYLREMVRHEYGEPNKEGRRPAHIFQFIGGSLTVETPEEEDIVRAACGERIFAQDTEELIRCGTCGFAARSNAAMFRHQKHRGHQ